MSWPARARSSPRTRAPAAVFLSIGSHGHYQAEGPILNAAYGAMQGLDGVLWLAAQSMTVDGSPHLPWAVSNGSQAMSTRTISHPAQIGMFPAAALIFRQRLIDVAGTVAHEERTVVNVLARRPASVPDGGMGAVSPLPGPDRAAIGGPQAFLQGRVEVAFAEQPAASRNTIRPAAALQTSTHGQLRLDSGKGLIKGSEADVASGSPSSGTATTAA